MPITKNPGRWTKKLKKGFLFFLACSLMFVIVEGLSSTLLFLSEVAAGWERLAKPSNTQYDRDLGWSNVPNLYIRDIYGPGVYFKTNSRGFRSNEEIETNIPAGKLRIICSGDSFTLGYGVDNDHTWCQQLTSLDPRIQTANMGQHGYGLDQAYLWYMRDGTVIDHDAQVFAMIGEDLGRMQAARLWGYGKPVLKVQNGELKATNVPVPRQSPIIPRLALVRRLLVNLKAVELMHDIGSKFAARGNPAATSNSTAPDQRQVVAKILESLQATNKRKNSTVILLYQPVAEECRAPESTQASRSLLEQEALKQGVPFLDLTNDFANLPAQSFDKLFLGKGSEEYVIVRGHYSAEGNRYVAQLLYQWLIARPAIAEKLSRLPASPAK